jgi:hypothetical protein
MVFLPNLGVNRRVCLCDVASYVSAQTLDFLDLGQKSAFLDWKHYLVPKLILTDLWMGTSYGLYKVASKMHMKHRYIDNKANT